MQDYLLQLFQQYPQAAIVLSILINIIIAIAGLVPTVFITAANILFFGFWNGTLISFLGESIGAAIAFVLYRSGFKKAVERKLSSYPKLKSLSQANNKDAFYLIFTLRLLPFVPSGLITFAASIGQVSFGIFVLASSLGKIPALILEAWSVYEIAAFGITGKIMLSVIALAVLFLIIRKIRSRDKVSIKARE